ncbi:MAG TPA: DUF503 domain-containing protein [bacterium]|nr:DUF503 domain-containing protein [bacterium]
MASRNDRKSERFLVGVSRIVIEMSGTDDLKAKRSIVHKVRDRLLQKYGNISVAEVGAQDVYDEAILGVCAVSSDRSYLESVLNKIPDFIDGMGVCRVLSDDIDIAIY